MDYDTKLALRTLVSGLRYSHWLPDLQSGRRVAPRIGIWVINSGSPVSL